MMGGGYDIGWFGPFIMSAFRIVVIVWIVFLILWLMISAHTTGQNTYHEDSVLEIFKRRCARGEISK